MKPGKQHSLCIAAAGAAGPASRARKQFNTLVRKLGAMRLRLAAWKEAMPVIRRQVEQELRPLARACTEQQRTLVLLFDQMSRHKAMGKKDRAKLAELICSIAPELMAAVDDAELKEIYNRHSGGDFDFDTEQQGDALKHMLEAFLGVQLDEGVDPRRPGEAPRERAGARAREQREAAAAHQLRQTARQTLRELFRKLVSDLHPDREPDAAERARKTVLMQRVNVAYAANDLLTLLELQLEVAQIDQAGLDKLAEKRIRQYNVILEAQLRELERETANIEYAAMLQAGGAMRGGLTPQALLRSLREELAAMQARRDAIAADVEAFQDVHALKAWLKTCRPAVTHWQDDAGWF